MARQQEIAGKLDRPAERTLRQLADEYLAYKADRGKRSLKEDRRITLRGWRRSKGRACK